jgi:hypothetical protein
MPDYTLVCPFLTDDPMFAYGVEFGLLYSQMQSGIESIRDYFCIQNQEQILLLANRLGWKAQEIRPWGRDWFWCVLEKGAPSRLTAGGE